MPMHYKLVVSLDSELGAYCAGGHPTSFDHPETISKFKLPDSVRSLCPASPAMLFARRINLAFYCGSQSSSHKRMNPIEINQTREQPQARNTRFYQLCCFPVRRIANFATIPLTPLYKTRHYPGQIRGCLCNESRHYWPLNGM
jgi:hypothetical protein